MPYPFGLKMTPRVSLPPTISASVPVVGPTAAGTPVTLTVTNGGGASSVTFGGTAATSVVVVNATTITCVAPAQAAGLVDIVVTTPAGSATLTNGYRFVTEQRAVHARAFSAGTWTDLSGNGRDVAGIHPPTLVLNSVNTNRSSCTFDGTTQFSLSADSAALSQAYTIYLVFKVIALTSGNYLFDGGVINTGVALFQPGGFDLYAGTAVVAHNTGASVGTWVQAWIVFNGASSSIQIGSAGTPTTGDPGSSGIAGVTIGASGGGGGQFTNIAVGEMVWMSGVQAAGVKTSFLANGVAYWGVA